MYRRALQTPSPAIRSPAFYTATSRTTTLCYRPSLTALSRYYSTPVHPPHDKQVQPPPAQTPSSTDDPHNLLSKATAGPPRGESQAGGSGTNADQLDEVKARVKEWSHDAVQSMRQRGDEFTARVARTFAQLGSELNRVTGYGEIEALKRKVVEQGASFPAHACPRQRTQWACLGDAQRPAYTTREKQPGRPRTRTTPPCSSAPSRSGR